MQISIRREVARMAEREAVLSEGANSLPLARLQEILGDILLRQSVTRQGFQSSGYPPAIVAALESVMEHFDALNFWMWLEVRGQVLLSLSACLSQVNAFVEMAHPRIGEFPQLTHLCLKLTAECDELAARALKNFYPLPEMHMLAGQSERVRQVMETLAG